MPRAKGRAIQAELRPQCLVPELVTGTRLIQPDKCILSPARCQSSPHAGFHTLSTKGQQLKRLKKEIVPKIGQERTEKQMAFGLCCRLREREHRGNGWKTVFYHM